MLAAWKLIPPIRHHQLSMRLLVCDLDGTLIDSMPMIMRAFKYAVEPWRVWDDPAALRKLLSGNYLACLQALLPSGVPPEAAVDRLVDYSRRHEDDVVAFEGAVEFLEKASAHAPVALWTNRDRHSTAKHLRRLGLSGYVREQVCGDDLAVHKPDPTGMLRLLEDLNVRPEDALFVGDSDVDVEGGVRAGMPTVLIRHGQEFPAPLEKAALKVFEDHLSCYTWILSNLTRNFNTNH
jgi:phosphoglycolate phosphatase/pyrophosphatase PpaX